MRIAPSLLSSRVVVTPASDERVSRSTPRQSHLAEAIAQEKGVSIATGFAKTACSARRN